MARLLRLLASLFLAPLMLSRSLLFGSSFLGRRGRSGKRGPNYQKEETKAMQAMRILRIVLILCVVGFGAVAFQRSLSETLVLKGSVSGGIPDGSGQMAFHFFDASTERLVYRALGDVTVSGGEYEARVPIEPIKDSGEVLVAMTSPETTLPDDVEVASAMLPLIPVWLQSSTPGTQQIGHANISGTLIAGAIETGAFRLTTGAGAGKVLMSDASGNGSWQTPPPPSGAAGGDLSGSYPNPTVSRLQTRPVSSAAPSSGQVLKWNGSAWAPAADDVGGLTLPFTGSANVGSGPVFSVTNTATSGTNYGGWFQSDSTDGAGVYGYASAGSGVNYGGFFQSDSSAGTGVFGIATAANGPAWGVWGASSSAEGIGVYGYVSAGSGVNYGGYFQSNSPVGTGVYAFAPGWGVVGETTDGIGVAGYATATSGINTGVLGVSDSTEGTGVYGRATANSGTTYGGEFWSYSTQGTGVYGRANADSGPARGVWGQSYSTQGTGVYGVAAATSGTNYGGYFQSNSPVGTGVFGLATATSGANYGGYFQSDSPSGKGVVGYVSATSGSTEGVWGQADSAYGAGVLGWATATSGTTYGGYFKSDSTVGTGVYARATATSGAGVGVLGRTESTLTIAHGVRGEEPSGGAGHAVYALGSFAATGTKSFQMDHPLDPANYYLNHFCTEGPEPYNVYRGNVVTDENGYATIALPDYFDSINRDPTYHLTVVDDGEREDFVLVKVVRKIRNNEFTIRTSAPHVEVSWEVKAIRNDRWVQKYGYQTVQEKEDEIKGKYLSPELYGLPKERGIFYHPEIQGPSLDRAPSKPKGPRASAPKTTK
ncbi:MAG: hypothetical protein D6724_07775 [Armatimonadetes bacterium]|nr:MAG: hypothetical protein D6724_07775 [Armatimonadota bacterium]